MSQSQIVKAVTNPTAGDVHVNTPLTNFSQKWLQNANDFVSLRAMPNLPVAKQSDLYYEFSRADFFRDEAELRADGAETPGGSFTLSTAPYFANVWGFHKDVSDRQRANQDAPVKLDNSAAQYVAQKLMIKRERQFATTFFNTGIWDTDVTTALSDAWTATAADPIADLRTGIRTVKQNTGFRPNRILFGRQAWDLFVDHDAVLDRIKGGATVDLPANVMKKLVAQTLEVELVEVMDSVYNSAVKGATEATGFIGSTADVLVYYAPMTLSLDEPTAGAQFSWTGLLGSTTDGQRIKRFRMEGISSDRIEGEMAFDFKVTSPELGYFIDDVLTG